MGCAQGDRADALAGASCHQLLRLLPTAWCAGHTAAVPTHWDVVAAAVRRVRLAAAELDAALAAGTSDGECAARAERELLAVEAAELARYLVDAPFIPLYQLGLVRALAPHLALSGAC